MKKMPFAGALVFLLLAVTVTMLLVVVPKDGGTGTFAIRIEGPGGLIFNGTIAGEDATAFDVLLAASKAGGFTVDYTGKGATTFVTAIGGYQNVGSGGWCYAVWHDEWKHPNMSSGAFRVAAGDAIWWHYEENGCSTN